jgi:alkyl hydroperoxide reductase subunit AhpC
MPAFDKRVSDFEAANTQVLGISTDSPFSHENWAKAVGISHYPLLSDVHRTVAKDYGVYWPDWNANNRATFVIDKTGKVRFVERYGKGELPDPDKMLAEVRSSSRAREAGRSSCLPSSTRRRRAPWPRRRSATDRSPRPRAAPPWRGPRWVSRS